MSKTFGLSGNGGTANTSVGTCNEDSCTVPLSEAIIELRCLPSVLDATEGGSGTQDYVSLLGMTSNERFGPSTSTPPVTFNGVSSSLGGATSVAGSRVGGSSGRSGRGLQRSSAQAATSSTQASRMLSACAAPLSCADSQRADEADVHEKVVLCGDPAAVMAWAHYSAERPSFMHPSGSWICRAVACTEKEMNYANGAISVHQSLTSKCPGVNEMAKGKTQARVMHSYAEVRLRYGLSHVELTVAHQFISRSDMFLISEALRDRIVYAGEELVLCGFRLRVSELLFAMSAPCVTAAGTNACASARSSTTLVRVGCGLVTAGTLINFQSLSPIHYLVIELSSEMWGTTLEGRTTLTCALKKFVGELVQEQLPRRKMLPHLRVVFTGRLRPELRLPNGDVDLYHTLDIPSHTPRAVDVVSEVELHCEAFLQSVLRQVASSCATRESALTSNISNETASGKAKEGADAAGSLLSSSLPARLPPPRLARQLFVHSRHANALETVCMIAEQCSQHYMNRVLDRSGHLITVLSAGKAHYTVTNSLVQVVAARLHDVGIEKVSVVCVGRPPLHVTPLLEYHSSDATLRTQYHLAIDVTAASAPVAEPSDVLCAGRYYEVPAWMSVLFYYPRLHTAAGVVVYDLLSAHEWRRRYGSDGEQMVSEMQRNDGLDSTTAAVVGVVGVADGSLRLPGALCDAGSPSTTPRPAGKEPQTSTPAVAAASATAAPLRLRRRTATALPFASDALSPPYRKTSYDDPVQAVPSPPRRTHGNPRGHLLLLLLLPGLVPSQDACLPASTWSPSLLRLPAYAMPGTAGAPAAPQRAEQAMTDAVRPAVSSSGDLVEQYVNDATRACNDQVASFRRASGTAVAPSEAVNVSLHDQTGQDTRAMPRRTSPHGVHEDVGGTPRDVPSPVRSSLRSFIACSSRPPLLLSREGEAESGAEASRAGHEAMEKAVVAERRSALCAGGESTPRNRVAPCTAAPAPQEGGSAEERRGESLASTATRNEASAVGAAGALPSSQLYAGHLVRAEWYTLHDAPRGRTRHGLHAAQTASNYTGHTTLCGSHPRAGALRAAASLESNVHVDAVASRLASDTQMAAAHTSSAEEQLSGSVKDGAAPFDARQAVRRSDELQRCSSATRPDASRCGCNVVDSDLRSGHLVLELTLDTTLLPAHRWSLAVLQDTAGWLRLMSCFVGRDDRLTSTTAMPSLCTTEASHGAVQARCRRASHHSPGGLTFHSDFRAQEIFCRSFSGVTADGLTLVLPTHANQCAFHSPEQVVFCCQPFLFRRECTAAPRGRPATLPLPPTHDLSCKEDAEDATAAAATRRSRPISIVHSATRQAEPRPLWSNQASSSSAELGVSLPPSERAGAQAAATGIGTYDDDASAAAAALAADTGGRSNSSNDKESSEAQALRRRESNAAEGAVGWVGGAAVVCYVQLRNSLLFAIRPVNPLLPPHCHNASGAPGNGGGGGVLAEDDAASTAGTGAASVVATASSAPASHALPQGVEGIGTAMIFRRRWQYCHPELGLEAPHVASWTRLCSCKLLPLYGTRSVYPPDSFYTVPPHQYTVVSEDAGEVRRRLGEFVLQRLQQQYQIVLDGGTTSAGAGAGGGDAGVWQPGWPRGEPAANVRLEMSVGHQSHLLKLSESARALTVTRLLHRGMYSNDPATHLFSYRYRLWNYLDHGRLAVRELHMEAQIGEQRAFPWEAVDLWVLERPTRHLPRGPLLHPRVHRIALVLLPEDATRPTPFAEFSSFIQYRFSIHLATQNKVAWEEDTRPLFALPSSHTQDDASCSASSTDAGATIKAAAAAQPPALMEAVLVQDDSSATRERRTRIDAQNGRIVALEQPVEERLTAIDIQLPRRYNARCCYILRVRWLACASAIVMDWHGSFVATAARYHLHATPLPCRDDSSAEDESEDEAAGMERKESRGETEAATAAAAVAVGGGDGDAVWSTVRGGNVFAVSYDVFAAAQDAAAFQCRLFAWLTHVSFQYFAESPVPFARCRLVHFSGLCYVVLAPHTCGMDAGEPAAARGRHEPREKPSSTAAAPGEVAVARWCQNVSVQQGTPMQKELLAAFQRAVQLAREGVAVPARAQT